MKKIFLILVTSLFLFSCGAKTSVYPLPVFPDAVTVYYSNDGESEYVEKIEANGLTYDYFTDKNIPVFANGVPLFDEDLLKVKENVYYIDLYSVASALFDDFESSTVGSEISISYKNGGEKTIFLESGSDKAIVNGKSVTRSAAAEETIKAKAGPGAGSLEENIDPSPLKPVLYVPLLDLWILCDAEVKPFGTASQRATISLSDAHKGFYLYRGAHIAIWSFRENLSAMTWTEAALLLHDRFLSEYEEKYGNYHIAVENRWMLSKEAENVIDFTESLTAVDFAGYSENDRFYRVPYIMKDILVDKYTGDIFTAENGVTESIVKTQNILG